MKKTISNIISVIDRFDHNKTPAKQAGVLSKWLSRLVTLEDVASGCFLVPSVSIDEVLYNVSVICRRVAANHATEYLVVNLLSNVVKEELQLIYNGERTLVSPASVKLRIATGWAYSNMRRRDNKAFSLNAVKSLVASCSVYDRQSKLFFESMALFGLVDQPKPNSKHAEILNRLALRRIHNKIQASLRVLKWCPSPESHIFALVNMREALYTLSPNPMDLIAVKNTINTAINNGSSVPKGLSATIVGLTRSPNYDIGDYTGSSAYDKAPPMYEPSYTHVGLCDLLSSETLIEMGVTAKLHKLKIDDIARTTRTSTTMAYMCLSGSSPKIDHLSLNELINGLKELYTVPLITKSQLTLSDLTFEVANVLLLPSHIERRLTESEVSESKLVLEMVARCLLEVV